MVERRNYPYEEKLEFMAAKSSVQPECMNENRKQVEHGNQIKHKRKWPDTPTTSSKRKCVSPEK